MVWYPSVGDIIKANQKAVRKDKHLHKLLRSADSIQAMIDSIRESVQMELTYQAARFMKDIVMLHAFDGGNHRTGYAIAILFLIENGVAVHFVSETVSYPFTQSIGAMNLKDIQEWIERYMV
jgi:death-on-curing family protein